MNLKFVWLFLFFPLFFSCDGSYAKLGVPGAPREWDILDLPDSSDRITWSGSQLALNSDTWFYTANASDGSSHNSRFLTFENPDSEGQGSMLDLIVNDVVDGPSSYTEYILRFGVYVLNKGKNAIVNEMDLYHTYEYSFRFSSQSDPYSRTSGNGVWGAQIDYPDDPYAATWPIHQSSSTSLAVNMGSGDQVFTRMDVVMNSVIADEILLARYLYTMVQATQILHMGWNGYGQGTRQIGNLIGAILSDEGDPAFKVRYQSPIGYGDWTMHFMPAFPPLPSAKITETMKFGSSFQLTSSIFTRVNSNAEYDWEMQISRGTGTGILEGVCSFGIISYDGTSVSVTQAALNFGEYKPVTGGGTDITNMLINKDFEIEIESGDSSPPTSITVTVADITPGNLDLTY